MRVVWPMLRVHRDEDHPNSRGLKLLLPYNKDKLQRLLQVGRSLSAHAGPWAPSEVSR